MTPARLLGIIGWGLIIAAPLLLAALLELELRQVRDRLRRALEALEADEDDVWDDEGEAWAEIEAQLTLDEDLQRHLDAAQAHADIWWDRLQPPKLRRPFDQDQPDE